MISENEKTVISKMIKKGDFVIDVGGNEGEWSDCVLHSHPEVFFDIYEPIPELSEKLENKYENNIRVCVENIALSDCKRENLTFYKYQLTGMSGLHRRDISEEIKCNLGIPTEITVEANCLDNLYEQIDFLKVDTEGNELNVLCGAARIISLSLIKTIQFEYGKCWQEQGLKLESAFELLESFPYRYKLPESGEIVQVSEFKPEYEDYGGGELYNYVFSKEPMK